MKGQRFRSAAFVILIACSACLAAPQNANAAKNYYISSSSGNDNNDGQSPEKAWKNLSKSFVKSTSKDPFQPGDNILLKRGDKWDGQLRLQAHGTAEKPVTVSAYGEGPKPSLYGDDEQGRWDPVATHAGIYVTDMGEGSILGSIFLNGKMLKIIQPTGSLNRHEDLEVFLARLQPATMAGQLGSRLWLRTQDSKPPNESVHIFRVAGVFLTNSSYVRIENLDIERFYTGIDISNSQQVFVDHNDIQDVLGIGIYLRSGDSHCRVESNTVFRSGNTALYVLKGSDNTFRDNWVSHVDTRILGLNVSGDGMGVGLQESQQSLVEYNYFAHSGGMDFYYEQGSTVRYNYLYRVQSAGAPHGVNLRVYGNIYNLGGPGGKPGSTGVNAVATGPGAIYVFNNTIFNAAEFFLKGSSKNGGKVVFSDNIAVSSVSGNAMTVFGANAESNHNCFSTAGQPVFRYNDVTFTSLKTFQAESGIDRGSIFSDPQFRSLTHLSPLDFRLSPNSGCNLRASEISIADPGNGRTYDHDHAGPGDPVIGALRVDNTADQTPALTQSCKSHCFQHPFAVASGVYLVRLKFAPSVRSGPKAEFSFVLNGRKVAAELESPEMAGSDDDLLVQYFLVRPGGASITLEPDTTSGISLVTEVDIMPFDTSHGDGVQVIPW
jgi:parallel beta-helix repeat protein